MIDKNANVLKDPRIKIFDPNYHNFNNFNSLGAFSLERNNSLKNVRVRFMDQNKY